MVHSLQYFRYDDTIFLKKNKKITYKEAFKEYHQNYLDYPPLFCSSSKHWGSFSLSNNFAKRKSKFIIDKKIVSRLVAGNPSRSRSRSRSRRDL